MRTPGLALAQRHIQEDTVDLVEIGGLVCTQSVALAFQTHFGARALEEAGAVTALWDEQEMPGAGSVHRATGAATRGGRTLVWEPSERGVIVTVRHDGDSPQTYSLELRAGLAGQRFRSPYVHGFQLGVARSPGGRQLPCLDTEQHP